MARLLLETTPDSLIHELFSELLQARPVLGSCEQDRGSSWYHNADRLSEGQAISKLTHGVGGGWRAGLGARSVSNIETQFV